MSEAGGASDSALYFITGGTTGAPKLVAYSKERFAAVVETKRRMLDLCGIGPSSRVLVIHPMAPWAIGQVFFEGALLCGASVFPAGLTLLPSTLSNVIEAIRPNVLCAGARNLQRLLPSLSAGANDLLTQTVELVLSAGEPLTESVRADIERRLSCQVRDIYGCAELDALAVESQERTGFWLVPDFEYALCLDEKVHELSPGATGVLLARPHGSATWHRTGDRVSVIEEAFSRSPWNTALIRLVGREGYRVKFCDGSAIGEEQLQLVKRSLSLEAIQLLVQRKASGDKVEVLYCSASEGTPSDDVVLHALLKHCTDFADAYQAGCIGRLAARRVKSTAEFIETERQKAPAIIVQEIS